MRYRNTRTGTVVSASARHLLPGAGWVEAEPTGSAPVRPAKSDSKDAWVEYAVATAGLTEAQARELTKNDLVQLTT